MWYDKPVCSSVQPHLRPVLTFAWCTTVLALGWATPTARAQGPVDMRANFGTGQTGRMFDANPALGGSGYNMARPGASLMGGNLYASGLAGRGMSLRSPSGISSPTAFRAPLGSSALSNFRRDSVSPLSTPLGVGTYSQPYFDASGTVPSVGLLQSGYVSGAGLVGGSRDRADLRARLPGLGESAAIGLRAPAGPTGPATGATPYDRRGPLSGMSLQTPIPPPPQFDIAGPQVNVDRAAELARLTGRDTVGTGYGLSALDTLAQPVGTLLRSNLYSAADASGVGTGLPGVVWAPASDVAGAGLLTEAPAGMQPSPALAGLLPAAPQIDPRIVPGFDVFNDLRMASALAVDPQATWFDQIQAAVRDDPVLQEVAGEAATLNGGEFATQILAQPVRTMTGRGASQVNDELLRAEASMELGRYVEAAERFGAAAVLDPGNPLPLLGQGHAYLAQGHYWSAATTLVRAIDLADRYPGGVAGLLLSRLDLKALMGGGEIVDIRRAALMNSLEAREDPELRFLLGYLEYHSGDGARGLENLRQAARHPRASAVIARYPGLLERGATVPLPRSALPAESQPETSVYTPVEAVDVPPSDE
ncbi:MAG: hypothetical protein IPM18_11545 [Phycisphaerales bacterium]|nr:hypothetical protein [Phycisphaerales bacterium]